MEAAMEETETWQKVSAYVYLAICVFDFIVVPAWIGITRSVDERYTAETLAKLEPAVQIQLIERATRQHEPFTLQGAGLFHLSFGALLTGSTVFHRRTKA